MKKKILLVVSIILVLLTGCQRNNKYDVFSGDLIIYDRYGAVRVRGTEQGLYYNYETNTRISVDELNRKILWETKARAIEASSGKSVQEDTTFGILDIIKCSRGLPPFVYTCRGDDGSQYELTICVDEPEIKFKGQRCLAKLENLTDGEIVVFLK